MVHPLDRGDMESSNNSEIHPLENSDHESSDNNSENSNRMNGEGHADIERAIEESKRTFEDEQRRNNFNGAWNESQSDEDEESGVIN